ncbi:MAG: hypothetical protein LBF81_06415 [Prevotellaceae bacterium]|jgi:hypothetical protein|nr:hypothetical protein [Prevotellaceae bacterium]
MKRVIFFFFAMAVSVTSIATQPEPPVYNTGNDEIAVSSADSRQPAVDSLQSQPALKPPVYYNGNKEPAGIGVYDVLAIMNSGQPAAGTLQPATVAAPLPEQAREEKVECPPYRTGKNEPVASGRFIATEENTVNNE